MKSSTALDEVLPLKDAKTAQAIPTAWRPVFQAIVHTMATQDYPSINRIRGVQPLSKAMTARIQDYIQNYGATLVDLPDDSWNSSACTWYGNYWEALVDLWTREEGKSDLALSVRVTEIASDFTFQIHMVYVP